MRGRVVTYGLVGLLVLCVVAQVEWWPLSAFKLFSAARTADTTTWQVTLVDPGGAEHVVPFGSLPRGYHSPAHLAAALPNLPARRTEAVCKAWALAGAKQLGITATEVRVYEVTGRRPAGGGPAALVSRTLTTRCEELGP